MLECRQMEQRAYDLFMQNLVKGTSHLGLGQEAIAAGFGVAMRADDYTFCTYRGHNHTLVRGVSMTGILGELMGRDCGLMRGKGGSMHLADFTIGILGESGIVASALPVAVGAALGSRMKGNDRVVLPFFGDGASNQGACHEAMNLAAIWKLPVIFLCENNQYAVTTNFRDTVAVENISDRAVAYNMPGILVDGQDVMAVYEVTQQAVARARSGQGPSRIEARTYRYEDHSEGLNRILREPYRTEEEVNEWRKRDPIVLHSRWLVEQDIATQEEIESLREEVSAVIEEALQFARESPYPEPEDLTVDLYADPIPIS